MAHKYSKMKIFHFREKLDSLPADRTEILPPIYIRIKPINACNHNCRYCAYRLDSLQVGKDMSKRDMIPRERLLEIMEDVADMGVKAVAFSGGGEPFIYPYLKEAVAFLASKGVKFAALTNGSRLQGELAEIFAEYGEWLRVSIDGWDDESYSSYREVPVGEFTRVLNNMTEFKRLGGKCHLGVSLIVDQGNHGHIYEFICRLKDIGVDSVKVSPGIFSNDASQNNAYHEPFFIKVAELVSSAVTDLVDDGFEIFDAYHKLDERFRKDYEWCPFIQILPIIGADLNVYCCQDKAYNLDKGLLGSIKNQRFRDFWHADKTKFFSIEPCIDCNHHCVANEKNRLILEYLDADKDHLAFV